MFSKAFFIRVIKSRALCNQGLYVRHNSLTHYNYSIFDISKLKAPEDDKLDVYQITKFDFNREENILKKEKHVLLFTKCFVMLISQGR